MKTEKDYKKIAKEQVAKGTYCCLSGSKGENLQYLYPLLEEINTWRKVVKGRIEYILSQREKGIERENK